MGVQKDDPVDETLYSELFTFKERMTWRASSAGNKKFIEITAPSKYLSNVWRTLEMSLIN